MSNLNVNQLIELIYESAIKPSKWTELLNALAEFVDHIEKQPNSISFEQQLMSVIPNISSEQQSATNASISETLKSINYISMDNEISDVTEANALLIGHFARALKIAKRLVDADEQHNIVLSLLDRMPVALLLVDEEARVVETNSLANELVLSDSGLTINNNILSISGKDNAVLYDVIADMAKHDANLTIGKSFSGKNKNSEDSLMFFVVPLKRIGADQKATVAVFVSQRKSLPLKLPGEFTTVYKLSNKERNVTEQLVKGLSIKEISIETFLSEHTVRSHVKSILRKTNTSRQAELVSLVYSRIGDFVNTLPESETANRSLLLNKTSGFDQNYNVFQLADGRNVAYAEYGDLDGEAIFHCHGVIGSRLELAINAEQILQDKSARLIIMDRPGYGASDPNSNNSFINWVNDLKELADYLNIKKFSVTGYAMGGVFALACAHQIPESLNKVAIISSGVAAKSSEDFKSMIPLYKMNNRLAKYLPKVYKLIITVVIKGILSDSKNFFKQFEKYLGYADRETLKSEKLKSEIITSLVEGYRLGGKNSGDEVIQLMHDWGFDISEIKIPIDIWHGTEDRHVPCILGERLTEHIKKTRFFKQEGQGHYIFYTHWSEILDELLS